MGGLDELREGGREIETRSSRHDLLMNDDFRNHGAQVKERKV